LVKAKLLAAKDDAEKAALYGNAEMMAFFVDVCSKKEMVEAVGLLGGAAVQEVWGVKAGGANWGAGEGQVTGVRDDAQKTGVYASSVMRDLFVDVCNNKEMAEAVDLLGGTLLQKLSWMKAEGSDWGLVRAKIAETKDAAQRTELYSNGEMLAFFVDVCNN